MLQFGDVHSSLQTDALRNHSTKERGHSAADTWETIIRKLVKVTQHVIIFAENRTELSYRINKGNILECCEIRAKGFRPTSAVNGYIQTAMLYC